MVKWMIRKKTQKRLAVLALAGLCVSTLPIESVMAQTLGNTSLDTREEGEKIKAVSDNDAGWLSKGVSGGDSRKMDLSDVDMRGLMTDSQSQKLSRYRWKECSDGKWRRIVEVPGLDLSRLDFGSYDLVHKPSAKPVNVFYDDGSTATTASGSARVIRHQDRKALEVAYNDGKPHNLMFRTSVGALSPDSVYELNFKYTVSEKLPNVTAAVVHNGMNIPGKSFNSDGTVNNQVNPVYHNNSVTEREGKLVFLSNAFTSGYLDIKLNSQGNVNVLIERLELVAVSDTKPEGAADREGAIREGDLVTPKNAGDFENWFAQTPVLTAGVSGNDFQYGTGPEEGTVSGNGITGEHKAVQGSNTVSGNEDKDPGEGLQILPAPVKADNIKPLGADPWEGNDFSRTGNVTISQEDKYKGEYSAKIAGGSELILNVDELKESTEYTIFFVARTAAKGAGKKLEFRLSGFKNNAKFDFDDGNYAGKWPEAERANMMNWKENLNITEVRWSPFRYDFTTGSNESNSVRARFKAVGTDVYVDEIYLVERAVLDEISYVLPPVDELSRGSRILIDQGLQMASWITTDTWEKEKGWIKQPSLDKILDMGLTAVQYNDKPNFSLALHEQAKERGIALKWSTAWGPKYSHISSAYQDSGDGKVGMPTEEEWDNGYLTEEMGSGYLKDLVSMCIGDEEDYSDTLVQNVKNWFELTREHYDNAQGRTTDILLHHNEVGTTAPANLRQISTFNKDMLRKYIQSAHPDMITYDLYYFRERRLNQTKGGTAIPFYDDLNRYRIVAGEGTDGTGAQPIPFGMYTYSWRTGPGAGTVFKRGDGWYEMTESQLNLYTFASLAFGAKWISNFRWVDNNPSYLFSDYKANADGNMDQYYIYDQFKEMVRQSKNLGPHLVRLTSQDVAIVRGQQTKNGAAAANDKPADNPDWSAIKNSDMNKGVHITDIQAKNLGTQNDGLKGDVFISYFNQLPNLTEEDKKVFTSSDPKYFAVLNGLTAGDGLPAELQYGSSYETRQEITITFNGIPQGAVLKKVSRTHEGNPGDVVTVPLIDGNKLVTVIGGGFADLYYWEEGTPNGETITGNADESGKEPASRGDQKYAKTLKTMELAGRNLVIGHIKGTDDLLPEPNLGWNIKEPREADKVDGRKIKLSTYDTPGANIGALGSRYFKQDIWEMRLAAVEKNNNVKLTFREYDWTMEELLSKLQALKDGQAVADMPDLLVVPNEWLWSMDGLLNNHVVCSMESMKNADGTQIFDLDARKWNEAYENMTTRNGQTYSSVTDISMDAIGMFVSKTLLPMVGREAFNLAGTGIYNLQKDDKWTFDELEAIMDKAIAENIKSRGIALFADNEYLLRQLLVSAGVSQDPYSFNADSPEYKEAIRLYEKLKENGLLKEGTPDQQMAAFRDKKLIFYVAPYTEAAPEFAESYLYYEDNTVRKTSDLGGMFGYQTYTYFKEADGDWTATVRVRPAGEYAMDNDSWNFMLFPKAELAGNYKAILSRPSYPLLFKGVENPEEVAFIWNEIAKEYEGVNALDSVLKRGGAEYPDPDQRYHEDLAAEETDDNLRARDLDALRKIGVRDGFGDNLKASGIWDNVLLNAIRLSPDDYAGINRLVEDYINNNSPKNPVYPE